jgi:hypothetical protein
VFAEKGNLSRPSVENCLGVFNLTMPCLVSIWCPFFAGTTETEGERIDGIDSGQGIHNSYDSRCAHLLFLIRLSIIADSTAQWPEYFDLTGLR